MNVYRGDFNYYGELHCLWTTASNERAAFRNFVARLSTKLGKSKTSINSYFLNTTKQRYTIRKE